MHNRTKEIFVHAIELELRRVDINNNYPRYVHYCFVPSRPLQVLRDLREFEQDLVLSGTVHVNESI